MGRVLVAGGAGGGGRGRCVVRVDSRVRAHDPVGHGRSRRRVDANRALRVRRRKLLELLVERLVEVAVDRREVEAVGQLRRLIGEFPGRRHRRVLRHSRTREYRRRMQQRAERQRLGMVEDRGVLLELSEVRRSVAVMALEVVMGIGGRVDRHRVEAAVMVMHVVLLMSHLVV